MNSFGKRDCSPWMPYIKYNTQIYCTNFLVLSQIYKPSELKKIWRNHFWFQVFLVEGLGYHIVLWFMFYVSNSIFDIIFIDIYSVMSENMWHTSEALGVIASYGVLSYIITDECHIYMLVQSGTRSIVIFFQYGLHLALILILYIWYFHNFFFCVTY